MHMPLMNIISVGPEPVEADQVSTGDFVDCHYIGGTTQYDMNNMHNYEFRVTCWRCGFIHHYSAYVFMEWYSKKERKNNE